MIAKRAQRFDLAFEIDLDQFARFDLPDEFRPCDIEGHALARE